jgi:hypothetical protein
MAVVRRSRTPIGRGGPVDGQQARGLVARPGAMADDVVGGDDARGGAAIAAEHVYWPAIAVGGLRAEDRRKPRAAIDRERWPVDRKEQRNRKTRGLSPGSAGSGGFRVLTPLDYAMFNLWRMCQ